MRAVVWFSSSKALGWNWMRKKNKNQEYKIDLVEADMFIQVRI